MPKLPKLVDLGIEETSGVDHPAHLQEGWIVMKAQDQQAVSDVLDRIRAAANEEQETFVENEDIEQTLIETEELLAKAMERIEELEGGEVEELDETASLLKSMPEPIVKMISDARAEAEEALAKAAYTESVLEAERANRADEQAIAKAASWGNLSIDPEVVGPMLRRLADVDVELAKAVETVLDGANAQAESAGIFAEIGKSTNASASGSAYGELTALAKAVVAEGGAATFEQAMVNIAGTNPDLYTRYLSEKGA